MGKMIITAYTDGDFNSECKSALELPVNPAKVKLSKGIRYAEDKQLGSLNGSNVYVLYDYNTEGHRPSFVKVQYGDITFFGQLKTLETEYSLFDPDSIPLRAELKVTLTGYCSQKEEKKHFSKRSPDVSRLVTLKEGQTLASLCYEIYGDALLVGQVARFNNLNGYRSIPAGTQLLMPMLKKE